MTGKEATPPGGRPEGPLSARPLADGWPGHRDWRRALRPPGADAPATPEPVLPLLQESVLPPLQSWCSRCSTSHVLDSSTRGSTPAHPVVCLGPEAEHSHLPGVLSCMREMRLEPGALFKAPNSGAGTFSPECPGSWPKGKSARRGGTGAWPHSHCHDSEASGQLSSWPHLAQETPPHLSRRQHVPFYSGMGSSQCFKKQAAGQGALALSLPGRVTDSRPLLCPFPDPSRQWAVGWASELWQPSGPVVTPVLLKCLLSIY